MSFIDSAINLALRGFRVFPLAEDAKIPAINGWYLNATDNLEQIVDWWEKFPNANVGVVTTDLLVVDLDIYKNPGATLADLDKTFTVRTGRGGLHYYYKPSARVANSASRLAHGVDIRADGGYVVGPGSIVDGNPYTIIEDAPIVKAPYSIESACKRPHQRGENVVVLDVDPAPEAAIRFLKNTPDVSISGQGGNSQTFKIACAMKDYGLEEEQAADLMLEHYIPRGVGPKDLNKVRTVVANAYRYANAPIELSFSDSMFPAPIWPLLDWKSLMSMPPVTWLVEDLIPSSSLGEIVGPSRSFKSFAAIQLALCVATGQTYAGKACVQGEVVYCAGEGQGDIARRALAWSKTFNNGQSVDNFYVKLAVPQMGEAEQIKQFLTEIKDQNLNPKLIILDTLSRSTIGLDENNSRDMMAAIQAADNMKAALGCALIFVHHTGKDAAKGGRGSSAIFASMDVSIAITRDSEAPDFRLSVKKQKDAPELENDLFFAGEPVDVGGSRPGMAFTPIDRPKNVSQEEALAELKRKSAIDVMLYSPVKEISTHELASGIATDTGADLRATTQWLKMEGREGKHMAMFVASRTEKGAPAFWTHPDWQES